jgi:hypothetical protein
VWCFRCFRQKSGGGWVALPMTKEKFPRAAAKQMTFRCSAAFARTLCAISFVIESSIDGKLMMMKVPLSTSSRFFNQFSSLMPRAETATGAAAASSVKLPNRKLKRWTLWLHPPFFLLLVCSSLDLHPFDETFPPLLPAHFHRLSSLSARLMCRMEIYEMQEMPPPLPLQTNFRLTPHHRPLEWWTDNCSTVRKSQSESASHISHVDEDDGILTWWMEFWVN